MYSEMATDTIMHHTNLFLSIAFVTKEKAWLIFGHNDFMYFLDQKGHADIIQAAYAIRQDLSGI